MPELKIYQILNGVTLRKKLPSQDGAERRITMSENARTLYIGKLQGGGWAAATDESPYFFFEGATEREVIDVAKEALSFCFSDRLAGPPVVQLHDKISLSQFFKKKTERVYPHAALAIPAE